MTNMKKLVSIIIPALNEEKAICKVIDSVPIKKLKAIGYETEIIVIDNGSTDRTNFFARKKGAKVIVEKKKGYGNAYKTGFANASGDIIVTGDADFTYPFEILPEILLKMEKENLDFINTDRLTYLGKRAMPKFNRIGNYFFSKLMKLLFRGFPFKDSQSGMWIFKKNILNNLNLKSRGMSFSQELKIEAYRKGFKCGEFPIKYRARIGKSKLKIFKDSMSNFLHLFKKIFD